MNGEKLIPARTADAVFLRKGMELTIIDVEGQQVADVFAVCDGGSNEFLSPGVTIDINNSLRLRKGDVIYTNAYRPMFTIVLDDVGEHNMLHPCCRPEMYDFFYKNGDGHPSCLGNINRALEQHRFPVHPSITPVNLFMRTLIRSDGSIAVERPVSKPGDRVAMVAEMDLLAVVAACSVEESRCNGGNCTSLRMLWR